MKATTNPQSGPLQKIKEDTLVIDSQLNSTMKPEITSNDRNLYSRELGLGPN